MLLRDTQSHFGPNLFQICLYVSSKKKTKKKTASVAESAGKQFFQLFFFFLEVIIIHSIIGSRLMEIDGSEKGLSETGGKAKMPNDSIMLLKKEKTLSKTVR